MQTHFKHYQRQLRKNMPAPEKILWRKTRQKQLGVKFRRQYTINNRILDFYAPQMRLGIEIDGHSHFTSQAIRQKEINNDKALLKNQRIKVLRFLNTEVTKNLAGILMKINQKIKSIPHPRIKSGASSNPPPLKEGGKTQPLWTKSPEV